MPSYSKSVGVGELPEPGYLHFTNKSKDEVCRCLEHWRHSRWKAVEDPIIHRLASFHFEKTGSQTCSREEWRVVLREIQSTSTGDDSSRSYNTQLASPPAQSGMNHKGSMSKSKPLKSILKSSGAKDTRNDMVAHSAPLQSDRGARILHYTEELTAHVCRCKHPILQHGDLWPVSDSSAIHQAALKYFERFGGLTCSRLEYQHLLHAETTPLEQKTRPAIEYTVVPGPSVDRIEHARARSRPVASSLPIASRLPTRVALDKSASPQEANFGRHDRREQPLSSEGMSAMQARLADLMPSVAPSQNSFDIKTKEGDTAKAASAPSRRKRISTLFLPNAAEQKLPRPKEFWRHHVTVCTPQDPPRAGAACKMCRVPFLLSSDKLTVRLNTCRHHFHEECLIKHFRIEDQDVGTCPTCSKPLFERTGTDRLVFDKKAIFGDRNTGIGFEMNVEYPDSKHYVPVKTEEQIAAIQLRILKDHIAEALDKEWTARSLDGTIPDWDVVVATALHKFRKEDFLPSRHCRYMPDEDAFLIFVCWAELTRIVNKAKCAHARIPEFGKYAFPPLDTLHKRFLDSEKQYAADKRYWKMDSNEVLPCEYITRDMKELCMASFPAN